MSDVRDEIASAAITWDAIRRQAAAHKADRDRRSATLRAEKHTPCRNFVGVDEDVQFLCDDCEPLERSHENYRAAAVQSGMWLRRLRRLIKRAQDH